MSGSGVLLMVPLNGDRQLPSTHAPNPPKHAHEDIGGAANVCWHLAVACTSQRQCAGLEGPQRRREARLSAIILCKGREAWREHHSQPDQAYPSTPLESRTEGETTLVDKVTCYTCYGWNTANGLRSGARATAGGGRGGAPRRARSRAPR